MRENSTWNEQEILDYLTDIKFQLEKKYENNLPNVSVKIDFKIKVKVGDMSGKNDYSCEWDFKDEQGMWYEFSPGSEEIIKTTEEMVEEYHKAVKRFGGGYL